MNFDTYQTEAIKTRQPLADLLYLCGRLATEGGEALQEVQNEIYHAKPLDRDALVLELGDILWYIANAASMLDVDLETVALRNIAKLRARHGVTYNPMHYTQEAQP